MKLIELCQPNILDKPTPGLFDISRKHKVSVKYLKNQLLRGIKIEFEHTSHPEVAMEIALDHLAELPDYYERLEKMEEGIDLSRSGLPRIEELQKKIEFLIKDYEYELKSELSIDDPDSYNEGRIGDLREDLGTLDQVLFNFINKKYKEIDDLFDIRQECDGITIDIYDAFGDTFPESEEQLFKELEHPILLFTESTENFRVMQKYGIYEIIEEHLKNRSRKQLLDIYTSIGTGSLPDYASREGIIEYIIIVLFFPYLSGFYNEFKTMLRKFDRLTNIRIAFDDETHTLDIHPITHFNEDVSSQDWISWGEFRRFILNRLEETNLEHIIKLSDNSFPSTSKWIQSTYYDQHQLKSKLISTIMSGKLYPRCPRTGLHDIAPLLNRYIGIIFRMRRITNSVPSTEALACGYEYALHPISTLRL